LLGWPPSSRMLPILVVSSLRSTFYLFGGAGVAVRHKYTGLSAWEFLGICQEEKPLRLVFSSVLREAEVLNRTNRMPVPE